MNLALFGEINSLKDLGLTLEKVDISPPEMKEKKISIPGRDGDIDLSDHAGDVKFENRKLVFTFHFRVTNNWEQKISEVQNVLHGKKFEISTYNDRNFFYIGRAEVTSTTKKSKIGEIKVTCDCEPYKMSISSTLEEQEWDPLNFETDYLQYFGSLEVSGSRTVTVMGMRKPVVPLFHLESGKMYVVWNGKRYDLQQGRNKPLGIRFLEGENTVELVGTGVISIEYRGGSL